MNKNAFKALIKESIRETLIEEGVLATIISEVMKSVNQGPQIVEDQSFKEEIPTLPRQERETLAETKRKMLDAIGKDAYNGVNLFEGTRPITKAGAPGGGKEARGPLSDVAPDDSGVDISSFMGSQKLWREVVKG